MTLKVGEGISGAIFSEDRKYRYALWRIWNRQKIALVFIGFNPSRADEIHDDPTVFRVASYAKDLNYGGIYIGNLFALVTTDPALLQLDSKKRGIEASSVGPENDKYLTELKRVPGTIVVGWGNNAKHGDRHKKVLDLLGKPVYCLGITKEGYPAHPLYLPRWNELQEYLPEPAFKG